jgi:hypothetical protein
MSEDLAKRVMQFIQIRDTLKRIDDEHEKKRAPLLEIKDRLSGILEAALDAANALNIKTEEGTFYKSTRYTASLADPDAFMNFVKTTGKFELIDRRANATAVRDYVKDTNQLPPGCNLNAITNVGVRRKPGSGSTPEDAAE